MTDSEKDIVLTALDDLAARYRWWLGAIHTTDIERKHAQVQLIRINDAKKAVTAL